MQLKINLFSKVDNDKKLAIILFTGIGVFLLYLFIDGFLDKKKWNNPDLEKRYTVGTIINYRNAGKGLPWFEYRLYFKGDTYEGRYYIESKIRNLSRNILKSFVGKRYYVKFLAKDPEYSKLLMGYPIPDSIEKAPVRGWKKLPR